MNPTFHHFNCGNRSQGSSLLSLRGVRLWRMTKQSPAFGIKSVLLSFQRLLRFARNDHFLLTFTISALMLFALNSFGCAPKVNDFKKASTISRFMDSWVGHYQSELIAYWGPSTKIVSDGKGGKIIIYESLKGTWGNERDKRIVGGTHYPAGPRQPGYAATRIFYVNEKGIIYSWKWSGL